ncbi:MAG TPA: pitrilysin family protein [Armatimonadota bacterium]|nr:insulinase family protein [Armatimonadota bacterium]HPO72383.1 pitrilysin family protein [Armatimonadota bacterium]HPT97292.1 pitrilysin family protein [Armatimonadota bacterium]
MTRYALLAILSLMLPMPAPARADYPFSRTHPSTLKYPELRFTPPEPVERTLPNGMTLYLMEDRELPLLHVEAYVKTGSIYDPAGKVGTARLTATVMRTGGSERLQGDAIDEKLEFVGGKLEVSVGDEFTTVSGSALSKDADALLEVLAEVLRRPVFPEEKLALAKAQMMEGIRRQNDQPASIANRVFAQALYGKESPWARQPTIAEVEKLSRADLVGFHQRTYAPNNTVLAIAADMSVDEMARRVERWLGDWERRTLELPEPEPVKDEARPEVIIVAKETQQANLRVGHLGISRDNADRYPVRVMNHLFGLGGFSSRLMRDVRSSKGLAYAVWGYLGEGRDRGVFEMGAETKVASARAAVDAMRQTLSDLLEKPVAPLELSDAQSALVNSFVARFTSPFQIAREKALLDVLGFPEDYLRSYTREIGAVTAADVHRVARAHLHPDRLVIVAVGPAKELRESMAGLGPVRVISPDETVR